MTPFHIDNETVIMLEHVVSYDKQWQRYAYQPVQADDKAEIWVNLVNGKSVVTINEYSYVVQDHRASDTWVNTLPWFLIAMNDQAGYADLARWIEERDQAITDRNTMPGGIRLLKGAPWR